MNREDEDRYQVTYLYKIFVLMKGEEKGKRVVDARGRERGLCLGSVSEQGYFEGEPRVVMQEYALGYVIGHVSEELPLDKGVEHDGEENYVDEHFVSYADEKRSGGLANDSTVGTTAGLTFFISEAELVTGAFNMLGRNYLGNCTDKGLLNGLAKDSDCGTTAGAESNIFEVTFLEKFYCGDCRALYCNICDDSTDYCEDHASEEKIAGLAKDSDYGTTAAGKIDYLDALFATTTYGGDISDDFDVFDVTVIGLNFGYKGFGEYLLFCGEKKI